MEKIDDVMHTFLGFVKIDFENEYWTSFKTLLSGHKWV